LEREYNNGYANKHLSTIIIIAMAKRMDIHTHRVRALKRRKKKKRNLNIWSRGQNF
jgi:hypothetical protein